MPNEDLVFVREVVLRCHDTVLMYARSVFPEDILAGEGSVFEHLGNRSLGEVLYQDPNLKTRIIISSANRTKPVKITLWFLSICPRDQKRFGRELHVFIILANRFCCMKFSCRHWWHQCEKP